MRAFAVLYAAELQSVAGDQLARVALSLLIFERTGSAVATALTYATTFLPAVLGGVTLAGLGDRYPRRAVLVVCDLLRGGLFAAMALPRVPLPAVIVLLVLAVFVGPAHTAANVSYLSQALAREQFRAATGARLATNQVAQVIGFGFGGGIVALTSPRGALLIDAATFVVAAAVVTGFLPSQKVPRARRASSRDTTVPSPGPRQRHDRALRTAIGLCWVQGFFVVPEGLAVPFGAAAGAGTTTVGLLFAALPLGGAIGTVLITQRVPLARRRPVSRAMAVCTGIPLVLTAAQLPVAVVLVAWTVSGLLSAYQLEVMSEIVEHVLPDYRARTIGRVSAGLVTAQGIGLALFGGVAQVSGARTAVAAAGLTGIVVALLLVLTGPRADRVAGRTQLTGSDPASDSDAAADHTGRIDRR